MATNRPKEVEGLTVESQAQELSSMLELDMSTLDAGYVYRWVHKTPLKVARQRARGYSIVDPAESEGIKNAVGDSPEAEDGTYTVGDLVLMRCKKLTHKARRHHVARKAKQRLRGPERKFRRDVKAKGESRGFDIEVITDKE